MLDIQIEGIRELLNDLRAYPQRVSLAIVRSMNRAMVSGRTLLAREVARDTGLRVADVRAALKLREAWISRPEAILGTSLKRIPLIKFRAKGPMPSRGKGRGVSYRLGRSTGRLPHAFIARMATGHEGVFERKGKRRLPIRELHGPSLGHVFAKYRSQGKARILEQFEKNLDHELGFAKLRASSGDE